MDGSKVQELFFMVENYMFLISYLQGFLDLQMKPWIRNFLTRCLAIVPSLIVALIGGSAGAGNLIIIASVWYPFLVVFNTCTCYFLLFGEHPIL